MYVDNITSKGVTLNSAGKSMQIEVYEKEIERLNTEIDYLNKLRDEDAEELKKKDNIINELEKYLEEHSKIDFESSDIILHEQLALSFVYDYLKSLKEGK